jgi:hypothetical protein
MEEILDVYCEAYDARHPLIAMDEAAKQVTGDLFEPLPLEPGAPRREDHHYVRHGTRAVFVFCDPLRGWRRVTTRESRTRRDWAEEVRRLLEEDYPDAETVTLVCDNLNTHHTASLYARFDAATAHRLARRLRLRHTPPHGSWLNVAEIELSRLGRQCLGRRFGSAAEMDRAITDWQSAANAQPRGIHWRFTTREARIKLKSLYPVHDN